MKFNDQVLIFSTLEECLSHPIRKNLFIEAKESLCQLKKILFNFDIDNIYVINEFIDRNIYSLKVIPIYFETSKKDLEIIVDKKLLENFPGIDFFISDKHHIYLLKENKIVLKDNIQIKKILLGTI